MGDLLKACREAMEIILPNPRSPTQIWITVVLWIVSIFIDPLFYYTLVIHDETKSMKVDLILLSVIFAVYTLPQTCRGRIHYQLGRRMSMFIITAEFLALMLTLVLFLLLQFQRRMDTPAFSIVMTLVLSLYLLRVFGLYRYFAIQVTRISSKPAKATGITIGLNLILYLMGSHLFGGLWYFSAVWKRMECWIEACSNHHGCHYAAFDFPLIARGDNKFLNNTCLMKNTNDSKNIELGITEEAFETNVMEVKNFSKKWLYCFRWGLQNLSNFGQSLKVNTHYWENIFVIFLALYGMITFTFFIGNMQNLVQQKRQKEEEIRLQEEEIRRQEEEIRQKQQAMEQWLPFRKLSEELQNSIKEYKQCKWQQTEGVNIENFLNHLPIDLQKSVKRDICLQMLKNTEKFLRWSEAMLVDICDCIKPVVYAERTRIVNEGDAIIEMYFVLQGNLWTYSSWSSTNNVPQDSNHLTYWGEELVGWAQNELSLSNIPRSNRTIQALTIVEAFAIMAVDLKNIFSKHNQAAQVIQSCFRRGRMRARNAQTSTQEQAPAAELRELEIVVVQE